MPRIELAILVDTAVLWPMTGYDAYGEAQVSDVAEEIPCKWEENLSQSQDKDGNTVSVDATVHVGKRTPIGSVLWKGCLEKWPGNATPRDRVNEQELMVVIRYAELTDIKGQFAKGTAYCARYRNTLPNYGS